MAWQMKQINERSKTKEPESQKLVSSNNAIERSPNGGRYKSYYEVYKNKK